MAFDWNEYLLYAQSCIDTDKECMRRIAVSRAYYASYHLIQKYLIANNIQPQEDKKHYYTWVALKDVDDEECQTLGFLGDQLRILREAADYKHQVFSPGSFSMGMKYALEIATVASKIP